MTKTTTIAEFIERAGITMTSAHADANPSMDDPDGSMNHFLCKLRRNGKVMAVPYSMGQAHKGKPKVADVLDCLASDATGYNPYGTFEDWCGEYGYDTDSRKAEKTWKAIGRQTDLPSRFLGQDLFEELVSRVERL